MKSNIIKDKTFDFALQAIELYKILKWQNEFVISKQLLRSATSIGANVNEALAAESRADFIHKLAIANKEAKETFYWLQLLSRSQLISFDYTTYIEKTDEIIKILTSIIKTTSEKKQQKFKIQNSKFIINGDFATKN